MRDPVVFALLGAAMLAESWICHHPLGRWLGVYLAFGFFACAAAYVVDFPSIWGKRAKGTIAPINYALFGGLHIIHWIAISTLFVSRKVNPCQQIAPNIWLGRLLLGGEEAIFDSPQVAVLDLTSEFPENPRLRRGDYLCIPLLDRKAPSPEQMNQALAFIQAQSAKQPVYIHCARGRGRSATVAAAWLLANGLAPDVDSAITSLKSIRSYVHLEICQREVLQQMYPGKKIS
jgi:protein-tyrosine phosphatase